MSKELEKEDVEHLDFDASCQLSAYRLRRVVCGFLDSKFLLDLDKDYSISFDKSVKPRVKLVVRFLTACGRYACWRLKNNQANEVLNEIKQVNRI